MIGSVADANRPTVVYSLPATAIAQTQSSAPVATQPVTIINNYYGNTAPMAAANALFGR